MNQRGFIVADFLFAFVLVVGCGIIIFAFTFSLATIEIGQYITWSAARSYSAAAKSDTPFAPGSSEAAGQTKFENLSKRFPLLTGVGSESPWFILTKVQIGDSAQENMTDVNKNNNYQNKAEKRQPWSGVYAEIELKLFESLRIPFIGKIATNPDVFKFPIRSFLLRNPSQDECLGFFENRYKEGIRKLEKDPSWQKLYSSSFSDQDYVPIEDNGC